MTELSGIRVGVLTVSDRVAAGIRDDAGGSALCGLLEDAGAEVVSRAVVADEREPIAAAVRSMAADGLAVVPAEHRELPAGAAVQVVLLREDLAWVAR